MLNLLTILGCIYSPLTCERKYLSWNAYLLSQEKTFYKVFNFINFTSNAGHRSLNKNTGLKGKLYINIYFLVT